MRKFAVENKFKITIAIVIIFIVAIFLSTEFFIDLQWFREVNYSNIFMTRILSGIFLFIPTFIISFFILSIYFKSFKKNILGIIGFDKSKMYNNITILCNIILSLVLSFFISINNWERVLQFINSKDFGQKDPIFNLDISFYMFKLPIIESIFIFVIVVAISMLIITSIVYLLISFNTDSNSRVIHLNNRGYGFLKFAGKQFSVISFVLLLLVAFAYVIRSLKLVYSPRGVAYGASYTDIKVSLLFFKLIIIASIISAGVVVFSIKKKKFRISLISISVVIILMILQPISATIIQKVIVNSNEMELEKPYIEYNIEATKKAFNIDNIKVTSFEPNKDLKAEGLNNNRDIIDNLKVNSAEPVLNFYQQVQLIKNYYNFNDVDTDRYNIDGKYNQVFIAPREINTAAMTVWQNKHLRYTHGYGVAMSKVNEVTKEGQPSFVMKDIPTVNSTDISIDNPRIYFGESTNDYAIVNTDIVEFDYPDGEKENEFKYDGKAGITMNMFNRLLFAAYEKNPKILISQSINSDSKILINRNIEERAKKIAPFLRYDKDAYPVIQDNRLLWVIDAYTVSDKYPFSEPYKGINYIRNSVKVTVDAYNGDINFYIIDESDPIINNYSKMFKGLFKSKEELPEGLFEHFRYPQEIFQLQSEVIAKYHVDDPIKFFTQEDLWDVSSQVLNPQNDNDSDEIPVELLYLMTRLPEEKNSEMMLFEYFNMKGKQNMVSLVGARMDGDKYGELMMYKFPQQRAIYSPYLFKNRILQDPEISKEISLWAGKGSSVIYGDIVIVPIDDSLLYLNTIYLKANTKQSMPEMKRVILSNGDKIVIEESVEKALDKLFNYKLNDKSDKDDIATENDKDNVDVKEAANLFNKAIEAQKNGNWAEYGEYINKLGEMLNKLDK